MQYQMNCPDGLHYDPKVEWPNYPCGYPMDVQCAAHNLPREYNFTFMASWVSK